MKKYIFLAIFSLLFFTNVSADTLSLGKKSEEVKLLQQTLSKIPNIYPEGLITGYFGALTQKAVKRLQRENGLEQVGFVGPKTKILLDKIISSGDYANYGYLVPQINIIESTNTRSNHAYIFWTTNKMTVSDFWYADSTPIASTTPIKITDNNLSLSHSVNLYGLKSNTTYYYIIRVTDTLGNSSTSTEKSFTTSSF